MAAGVLHASRRIKCPGGTLTAYFPYMCCGANILGIYLYFCVPQHVIGIIAQVMIGPAWLFILHSNYINAATFTRHNNTDPDGPQPSVGLVLTTLGHLQHGVRTLFNHINTTFTISQPEPPNTRKSAWPLNTNYSDQLHQPLLAVRVENLIPQQDLCSSIDSLVTV
ncbi:hypothetical protein BS17DRAFT_214852 [Gyrodon lividus]|nr:hypothetical protein BS17DRAFT_214852 [Gyrodon lividus]